VSVYLAVVAAVPVVVAAASNARARMALALTIAATWAVTLYAYERFVPDRDEVADALTFFTIYIHLVTPPVAGTLAMLLVPKSRGVALPMVAALVGSVAAVVLRYALPLLFASERLERALDVMGPVVFASTAAVLVASLTARRTA
jgi:hypothetical protein